MAEILKTLKKLREARFFLAWMRKVSKLMDFEREDFDFCLSAFLSAGRSVTFCLCSDLGGKETYKPRFDLWWNSLEEEEREEMNFFRDQRNAELKAGRAAAVSEIEMVPEGGTGSPNGKSRTGLVVHCGK
jgi:hypothetical protein